MRASFRVAEERADALVEFRRDDMFESAGLLMRFDVINGESIGEKPLRQSVAANHIARPA
jgi:hypothetical protein